MQFIFVSLSYSQAFGHSLKFVSSIFFFLFAFLCTTWLFKYVKKVNVKKVKVAQSCPILCNPMIVQARILRWVALPFSRGSSKSRDQTQVQCCIAGGFFTN